MQMIPTTASEPRMGGVLERVEKWRRNPPPTASVEVADALAVELLTLVTSAVATDVDFAAWLASAVGEVAAHQPEGIESLLARRPGGWEAEAVRDLVELRVAHPPTGESSERLVDLLRRAQDANVEIAGWLASTLGVVAAGLPKKAETILRHSRSGKREDAVRQLVYGTIGWPGVR